MFSARQWSTGAVKDNSRFGSQLNHRGFIRMFQKAMEVTEGLLTCMCKMCG